MSAAVREMRPLEIVGLYESQRKALEVLHATFGIWNQCMQACAQLNKEKAKRYGTAFVQMELAVLRAEMRTLQEQLRDARNLLAIQVRPPLVCTALDCMHCRLVIRLTSRSVIRRVGGPELCRTMHRGVWLL